MEKIYELVKINSGEASKDVEVMVRVFTDEKEARDAFEAERNLMLEDAEKYGEIVEDSPNKVVYEDDGRSFYGLLELRATAATKIDWFTF